MRIVLCLILFAVSAAAAQDERPNIVFISIDDQNDWIGCLGGHPQAQTPAIDGLAARGVVFTNAHCQAPLCNPSRTSLMTGLRPTTTGVYGLSPWIRDVPGFADVVTLPQRLKAAGYTTLSAGKIYHGGYGRGKDDREFDVLGPGASAAPFPPEKLVNTPQDHQLVDWGQFPHQDEDKGDWKVASWAVEQLESDLPEPFFLSAGFFLPHVPCYATEKWFDLYPSDGLQLPLVRADDRDDTPRASWFLHWRLPEPRLKFLLEADEWKNLTRSYLACVSFVDSQVARLLDALERSGRRDRTIVVLWSDHGFHLGEKLITGKNTLWDDGTRVPLIFAGPGTGAAGSVCREPAELLDIYPTLCDLCGIDAPKHLEGISLRPQLEDSNARRRPAITSHNAGNHGVRSRDWRYIQYADGSEELYHTASDPNEWFNLAGNRAFDHVIAEHRRWLPKDEAPPAPNSAHRVLTFDDDGPVWEGERIGAEDPVPEL